MGCQNVKLCQRLGSIYIFFLWISSSTQVTLKASGRATPLSVGFSQIVNRDQKIVRARIGSRPPRCERRCSSCEHCEAIQVPTNPATANHGNVNYSSISNVAYARGEDGSNYKPMSWKCKCGSLIFNP